MIDYLSDLDVSVLVYLNGLGSETYDGFWKIVTHTLYWIPVFILVFVALLRHFSKKEVLVIVLSLFILAITTGLTVMLFKEGIMRLRPNNTEGVKQLLRLVIYPKSYSFISGHATNSIALTAFVVAILKKKTMWIHLFWLWPILFIFSRLYFGVHYPSDIISGIVVGFFLSFAFCRFHNFLARKLGIY